MILSSTNFLGEKPNNIYLQPLLHEKDHEQLIYQFLNQLLNACVLLWMCKFLSIFLLYGCLI